MVKIPTPNPRRFEIESIKIDKHYIINKDVKSPDLTENLTSLINLKAFLKDLNAALLRNGEVKFLDMRGPPEDRAKGKFFDHQAPLVLYPTATDFEIVRTGNMFEHWFTWTNYKNGDNEVEIRWYFRAELPNSKFAWMEVEFDLVNRQMKEREVEVNGKKQKMYDGMWEFRNKMTYRNNIIRKKFWNTPIVKENKFLQEMYLDYIYYQKILDDVQYCKKKLKPIVYDVIAKHFGVKIMQ